MPIDHKNYPANWKAEIRPAILKRAGNCCETCKAPNNKIVCRGTWNGVNVWQCDDTGSIFNADTGAKVGESYVGDVWEGDKSPMPTIVLTIAHLDHDTTNNDYGNLKALCQRCHLRLDAELHKRNAAATRRKKLKIVELF